jgi:hypothetical protein
LEYRYSRKQFILNQDNGRVQKFTASGNRREGYELALCIEQSDPRALLTAHGIPVRDEV